MKFVKYDKNKFRLVDVGDALLEKLPSAAYGTDIHGMTGDLILTQFNINSDEIIDIPTPEYSRLTKEFENFLTKKTRDKFKSLGFIYKRSALLYGKPGTGKTCLINRVANDVIEKGGLVFFNPTYNEMEALFNILNNLDKDRITLIIFEEFDEIARHSSILSVLDGEIQKSNTIFLATTNFIEKIAPRVIRPGRFSSVIEVGCPDANARQVYLKTKFGKDIDVTMWTEKTKGFTIDEIKETVLAVECFGQTFSMVLDKIKAVQGLQNDNEKRNKNRRNAKSFNQNDNYDYEDDE